MRFFSQLTVLLIWIMLSSYQALAAEPMVISGTPDGPPVCWSKQDTLSGVGPELAVKILTDLKIPFTMRAEGQWQQVQDKAKAGTVDMIVSAYDNSERRTYLDYSIPYLKSPVVIMVKKGDLFPFTSWKSLIGRKGVTHTGESFGEEFDTFIQEKLDVSYVAYERAFEMLAEDTADYLIIDLYPALVYSKLLGAEDKVEFIDTPATMQHFHLTISKKSPYRELLPEINRQIAQLQKQQYIQKLAVQQYQHWTRTLAERKRFYAEQQKMAQQSQSDYDAGARDRGLENLSRFIEGDVPYMDGSNFD